MLQYRLGKDNPGGFKNTIIIYSLKSIHLFGSTFSAANPSGGKKNYYTYRKRFKIYHKWHAALKVFKEI
jgi:hypothetical protein